MGSPPKVALSLISLVKFPVGHLAGGPGSGLPTGPGPVSWVPRVLTSFPQPDFFFPLSAPSEHSNPPGPIVPSSLGGLGLAEQSSKAEEENNRINCKVVVG